MRDEDQRTASTLSRRSMIAGSAFSVPVIMSVAATPAMAASFNVITRSPLCQPWVRHQEGPDQCRWRAGRSDP